MRRVRGGTRNAMCNKGFLTRGARGGGKEMSDKYRYKYKRGPGGGGKRDVRLKVSGRARQIQTNTNTSTHKEQTVEENRRQTKSVGRARQINSQGLEDA